MSKKKFTIFIVVAFISLVPVFAWADLTTGLVGYWKFDDPANLSLDSSGYGNNGMSNANYVSYFADGVINGAAKFIKGSNEGIVIPHNDSLDLVGAAITVAAWVNLDSGNNGDTVISKSDSYK